MRKPPFEVAADTNFSEGILKVVLPVETVASLPSPPSSPLPSLTSCSSSRGGPVFPVTFETSSGHESSGGGDGGGARAVRHDREQQVRLAPLAGGKALRNGATSYLDGRPFSGSS